MRLIKQPVSHVKMCFAFFSQMPYPPTITTKSKLRQSNLRASKLEGMHGISFSEKCFMIQ